ncbi:hypothetical protein GUJ93_ZPchr0015g6867 [Zizania palustris]|uniref:Uncharacterized protein n=1 Tax=Zizania palustris TaxID=103762 RepID=A0A8J5SYS5_ZIZPA|nr:hypothetical protein GUJ93_ZPchr0015g6867 [Zizania palustris]
MMRKIGYLLQPEFEGLEFAEGECFFLFYNTEHEEDTTIVHMARMMESMDDMYTLQGRESRKEIEAQGEKLRCLERELEASQRQEQQRFAVEIPEGTGECAAVAPAPVPALAPQGDQPMGEDSEEPTEEEFFEESRTERPLIGYTPAP